MSELARRYAAACYDLFPDAARFADAARFIGGCTPLREALEAPTIDWREKERVLARLPLFLDSPQLLDFYRLLVQKGRMSPFSKLPPVYANAAVGSMVSTMHAARAIPKSFLGIFILFSSSN